MLFRSLLFIWLMPVMTTSVLALNLGLTAYIYIGSLFEERRLVAEFGEPYTAYQRRVPRLIPVRGNVRAAREHHAADEPL